MVMWHDLLKCHCLRAASDLIQNLAKHNLRNTMVGTIEIRDAGHNFHHGSLIDSFSQIELKVIVDTNFEHYLVGDMLMEIEILRRGAELASDEVKH